MPVILAPYLCISDTVLEEGRVTELVYKLEVIQNQKLTRPKFAQNLSTDI